MMYGVQNGRGEMLVYSEPLGGPRFHEDVRFARTYRTRKGAKIAISNFKRRYGAARMNNCGAVKLVPTYTVEEA
jgi:hypothetical protein